MPNKGGSLAVITTVFNDLQPKKALSLISLTFSGISICSKAVQFKKASSSINSKLLGNVIVFKEEQKEKAPASIFLPTNFEEVPEKLTFSKFLHFSNVFSPIIITLEGSSTEFKNYILKKHSLSL